MLDERLRIVAEMIPPCDTFADIGTDHGYLGCFLLRQGRVRRAELTDISAESLDKARRLIAREGLGDRCSFGVGDGCRALKDKPDVAVIAGMGGKLIARILREGRATLAQSRVVTQPNLDMADVRRAMMETGFCVADERIARAAGRHYVIIAAEPGEAAYDETELEIGPVLLRRGDPHMASFAAFRVKIAEKALAGARSADAACAEALERECALWRGMLAKAGGGDI